MAAAMEAATARVGRRWEVKAVRGDMALLRPEWEAAGLRCIRLTAKTNQPPIRSRLHDVTTSKNNCTLHASVAFFICVQFP
jgi:hypothetical protein